MEISKPALILSAVRPALVTFWLVLSLAGPAAAQPTAQSAPCRGLDACTAALASGRYDEARAGLGALTRGSTRGAATLVLARVELETGRYAEAEALVRPLSARGNERVAASTLMAEAQLARGQLDEAQRTLEGASREPSAHRARVLLGRLLLRRGRDAEARLPLMTLVSAYNDSTISERDAEGLAYVAMAADMLESPHDANDAYQESTRNDATRVETQLEWAALFLRHHDTGHAEEGVRAALEHNPRSARALAMLARIQLEQTLDFVGAQESLDRALAVNPNLPMAHVTRAGIAIRDMDLSAANEHIERALAIDPNDLEALSVRAALRFLADDDRGYRAAVRAVLQRNAHYSTMYSIIAEYANWEHRYPQIVEMAREAVRLNPSDAAAHATLGINLLRMGEEEEGLAALREAWRRDRFNVRVFNLLNLWDDVITRDYEEVTAGPIIFRMHREERAVMGPTASAVLRRAWDDMRRRYRFTPRTPVHIEMYSDPQHFSVRTSGLPNVGVQGVCFGQVVTALSPRAGPFNWAQITWHELAHVFHIQMSRNRVPRWFTEGLAEYETIIARPEWQREEDHRLYLALESGRVPPVAQLNHAFTHARTAEDMTVAYYASSMLVKYIVDSHGFDKIPRMLRAWGEGRESADVIQRVLGISSAELDTAFRAHTRQRLAARAGDFAVDFGAYRDLDARRAHASQHPGDLDAQAALAAALTVAGENTEAMSAVRSVLRRDRDHALARFIGARLALTRRDARTARADLRLLIASGHDGYEPRLIQARLFLAQHNSAAARVALEAAARIDPTRPEAWQGLLHIAEESHDAALRANILRHLVDVDQHDRGANFAMMQLLAEQQDWTALREYGERSVYVDPLNAEARRLYAEALLHTNAAREAVVQAELALAAEPEHPATVHLTRARAFMAAGRRRQAREAATAAIAADPSVREEAARITSGR